MIPSFVQVTDQALHANLLYVQAFLLLVQNTQVTSSGGMVITMQVSPYSNVSAECSPGLFFQNMWEGRQKLVSHCLPEGVIRIACLSEADGSAATDWQRTNVLM